LKVEIRNRKEKERGFKKPRKEGVAGRERGKKRTPVRRREWEGKGVANQSARPKHIPGVHRDKTSPNREKRRE